MCLIISRERHSTREGNKRLPIVVKEDIPVWKILGQNGSAYFHDHFYYKPNTLYKKRKLRPTKECIYGAAFHAYSKKRIKYGYLAVKMIIPKGATVFYGRCEEIATNMIQTLNFPKGYKPNV